MIRLHHIDCMAFMREAPDRAFDLAIVDPPYGINATRMNMGTHLTRHGDGYPGESYASRNKPIPSHCKTGTKSI